MIKLFEQFNNEQEIHDICKKYKITNYTINTDGSIDVDGDVNLAFSDLDKLPLKFETINGNFTCAHNYLTTLEGSPKRVGFFFCNYNKLTSLKGAPIIVDNIDISDNPISIIDSSIQVKKGININHTGLVQYIKLLSKDRLVCLFEHGVDYNIYDKNGTLFVERLKRLFKDFNI